MSNVNNNFTNLQFTVDPNGQQPTIYAPHQHQQPQPGIALQVSDPQRQQYPPVPPPATAYDPATKPNQYPAAQGYPNGAQPQHFPPQQPQLQPAYNNSNAPYYPPGSNGVPHQFTYAQPYQIPTGGYGSGVGIPPVANDFQHDLFGCFQDMSACLEGWCCGYCQVASQYNRVEHNEADVYWPMCLGMAGLDYCCGFSGIALCIGNMITREKLRRRYNIGNGSSGCEDCCVSVFCTCCAVIQQHREMTTRGEWPGGILVSPPLPPRQDLQMGVVSPHHQQPHVGFMAQSPAQSNHSKY